MSRGMSGVDRPLPSARRSALPELARRDSQVTGIGSVLAIFGGCIVAGLTLSGCEHDVQPRFSNDYRRAAVYSLVAGAAEAATPSPADATALPSAAATPPRPARTAECEGEDVDASCRNPARRNLTLDVPRLAPPSTTIGAATGNLPGARGGGSL
jgi:hypothetical protein